jgi:hypothetical protein
VGVGLAARSSGIPSFAAISIKGVAGALIGLFLLLGRWTPTRIMDADSEKHLLFEPRLWVWAALLVLTVSLASRGKGWSRIRLTYSSLYVYLLLALGMYWVFTLCWTANYELAFAKAYEIVMIVLFILTARPWLSVDEDRSVSDSFWLSIIVFGFIFGIMGVHSIYTGADRTSVLGGGTNVFGRNMGLLAMGGFYLWNRGAPVIVCFPLIVGGSLLCVLSGSRGSLLALIIGIFAYLTIEKRWKRTLPFIVGMIFFGYVVIQGSVLGGKALELFYQRVVVLTLEEGHTAGRGEIYSYAFELGVKNPILGAGLGACEAKFGKGLYAHNMVLEVFSECGFIGVAILILIMAIFFYYSFKHRKKIDSAMFGSALLLLTASQVSGDIFDSRGVFILILFILGARWRVGRERRLFAQHNRFRWAA